jgi:hypothetical protein
MNIPAPKRFTSLPGGSNLWIGAASDPSQLLLPQALEHPDAPAVGIDADADGLAELALVAELRPVLDRSVGVGRVAGLRVSPRSPCSVATMATPSIQCMW